MYIFKSIFHPPIQYLVFLRRPMGKMERFLEPGLEYAIGEGT